MVDQNYSGTEDHSLDYTRLTETAAYITSNIDT